MILAIQCNSVGINNILYIIKQIMNLIMIVSPILLIISFTILFTQLVMKPEEKKLLSKLRNATLALLFVFFMPLIVNVFMSMLGDSTDLSKCYNSADNISNQATYISTRDPKEKKSVLINKDDYEEAEPKQLDFSCKSNKINANFSCETIHIVEHHLDDLNYYNFNSVISSYGGFKNYTKSIGGIFAEYYGEKQNVTKVYEFQRVSEYVFGYMTMYGFDYYNGRDHPAGDNQKYCKWGGSCLFYQDVDRAEAEGRQISYPTGSGDAFYPGQLRYETHGLSDKNHFDNIISGKSGLNMTTNCNWSVDMVYFKAGIFGTGRTKTNSSANYSGMYSTAKKVIYKAKDLEVGDVLAFFRNPVPNNSGPSSWHGWYHAAYVGETHKSDGYVVIYDGGSRLTNNRSHKWKLSTKDIGNNEWVGFRLVELG